MLFVAFIEDRLTVIPAQAGIDNPVDKTDSQWIPLGVPRLRGNDGGFGICTSS
jgi:hypothetical protein